MENVQTTDNLETSAPASQQAPEQTENVETQSTDANTGTQETATEQAERKYKLKVYGEEKEYSEAEVLKFAQLGSAGQKAMEKAALLEKKQREFYGWLREALAKDPDQVAEIVTGQKRVRQAQAQATEQGQEQTADPRDAELRQYQDRLQKLEAKLEQDEIEKERQAIESELDAAVKKYPELDNPFLKSYVKQEYRKVLKSGVEDMSMEDVAFYVAQEYRNQQAAKAQTVQKQFDNKKQAAPVMTKPAPSSSPKKQMTLDDVKRLAGRQV